MDIASGGAEALLPYRVGALLYAPGVNENVARMILGGRYPCLASMAFCLEDAVRDDALEKAEAVLRRTLDTLARAQDEGAKLPLLFVRVRTPEHLLRVHGLLGASTRVLTGYILPKFDFPAAREYVRVLPDMEKPDGTRLRCMPILETPGIADIGSRKDRLPALRELLGRLGDQVLNVRVGGADLCNLYGLRRSWSQTIYDVGVVRDALVDVVNVFGRRYVVSGPVWEYFGDDPAGQWAAGLRREAALDQINGFVGKTAIHPSQLPVLAECFRVPRAEYEDALVVLDWRDGDLGVARSERLGRMNEEKCHTRWAMRTVALAQVHGLREDHDA